MKRIVEKYSELMVALGYAEGLAIGAVVQGRRSDAYEYIDKEIGLIRENKNNEILLSEVKEDSVICSVKNNIKRIAIGGNDRIIISSITGSGVSVQFKHIPEYAEMLISNKDNVCYVAKNYKQALKWLVREDSKENNDILITED